MVLSIEVVDRLEGDRPLEVATKQEAELMSSGNGVKDAFEYVTTAIQTIRTMLLSADPVLTDIGWIPYREWEYCSWPTEFPEDGLLSDSKLWLPRYFTRHYYRQEHEDTEMLSVVAVPWEPGAPGFKESACIVSHMAITTDDGDDHYWLAGVQLYHEAARLDGAVRELDPKGLGWILSGWLSAQVDALRTIPSGRILSVGRPLTSIADTATLKREMLDPIVGRLAAQEAFAQTR